LADEPGEIPHLFQVSGRKGIETVVDGFLMHNTLGGYIHLHFGSNPEIADSFVGSCREYQEKT
jgi:cobyrinic acid a,c-diamide synthase